VEKMLLELPFTHPILSDLTDGDKLIVVGAGVL
jgi:hypothetical protein